MNIQLLQYKEQVVRSIRDYFYNQQFHEVIVPVLQKTIPLEPNIYPFTSDDYVLPTSPESTCIQYLAGGGGNCFAVAPAFRNLEAPSPIHTPEFLMLEWYREDATLEFIMEEAKKLILYVAKKSSLFYQNGNPWQTHTMSDLFQQHLGVSLVQMTHTRRSQSPNYSNPSYLPTKPLVTLAKEKGYETKNATWEQLFNQIFLNEIEPHLGTEPVFVTDYPSCISPLCAPKTGDPDFAERFELYIDGIEIANGNKQKTTIEDIRNVFISEQKLRKEKGIISPPIDEVFLKALKNLQTKNIYGVGLGIDRLGMVLSGAKDIRL